MDVFPPLCELHAFGFSVVFIAKSFDFNIGCKFLSFSEFFNFFKNLKK